ncbi:hypothetical protein ACYQR9_15545 [Methylobacterium sp. CM6241]
MVVSKVGVIGHHRAPIGQAGWDQRAAPPVTSSRPRSIGLAGATGNVQLCDDCSISAAREAFSMFIKLTDYHGNPAELEAESLLKLRPALANLGDPDGCTLVDGGNYGIFALGNIQAIAGLFAPYVRLASLHTPDGKPTYLNADGIVGVAVDKAYAGKSVALVGAKWQNINVPSRNKIPLMETVAAAKAILEAAAKDVRPGTDPDA